MNLLMSRILGMMAETSYNNTEMGSLGGPHQIKLRTSYFDDSTVFSKPRILNIRYVRKWSRNSQEMLQLKKQILLTSMNQVYEYLVSLAII